MAASTAPAVKATLLTLLETDADFTGVGVTYSDPGSEITQEAVFYGRTITTEVPTTLGQRNQRETYDVEVYVYVAQDGNDAQACETRAWALVAALESLVRAYNGAQGQLTKQVSGGWLVYAGTEMTPFTYNGQRVCEALCKINVSSRK